MGGDGFLHLFAFVSFRKTFPEKPFEFEQVRGAPNDDGIVHGLDGDPIIRPDVQLLPDLGRQRDLTL
jgi:hypothetical protein